MSTTTPFGTEFIKELFPWILNLFDDSVKSAYHMIWGGFIWFVMEYWISITIVLALIFIIALGKALTGSWGMLGGVLYNYLYFGILFCVGLIKGPEVFVSEYFEVACAIILYPTCYLLVGKILDSFNLRDKF